MIALQCLTFAPCDAFPSVPIVNSHLLDAADVFEYVYVEENAPVKIFNMQKHSKAIMQSNNELFKTRKKH